MATSCQETHSVPALRGTSRPLAERYAALLTDLDGVTYRGSVALPYAVEALTQARCGGTRILFVTNKQRIAYSAPGGGAAQQLGPAGR